MAADAKIIERIRKLLAMAADVSSPNEAAIAAERAAKLMRAHNLESADAIFADLKKSENIIAQAARGNIWRKKARSIPVWSQGIAILCAELFDCHVVQIRSPEHGWSLKFMGYKTDVEVCLWTYGYLLAQCQRFADRFAQEHPEAARSTRTAYHDGVSHGIRRNLKAAKLAKEAADRGNRTGTALVVAKRAAIEDQFGKIEYGERERKTKDTLAFFKGLADGDSVNVNKQVLGSSEPNPQLPH